MCEDKEKIAEKKYVYGPVPSRRLGRSLGVDIVPFKVCTLDCAYCQLGKTTEKTIERKKYCDVAAPLEQLKDRLAKNLQADYITISGSGEPTLNSQLGEIIKAIKKLPIYLLLYLLMAHFYTDRMCERRVGKLT